MPKARVLVVDDSAAIRRALSEIINSDPELEVMAVAASLSQAIKRLRHETPDVITLDLDLPELDSVKILRRATSQSPIPVVMCSPLIAERSKALVEALAAGAVDVIAAPQPGAADYTDEGRQRICNVLKAAARVISDPITATSAAEKRLSADEIMPPPENRPMPMPQTTERIIAIGASTGGPEALQAFLASLPLDCPPTIVVQHMPAAFTHAFANRLNGICQISVREAANGDRLLRGQALISPGGVHTVISRRAAAYYIELRDGPPVSRHRPSVDVLFRSVATAAGPNATGVILTGMGDDGANGLKEMRQAGAQTIGQDEATSIVYGMPQAAFAIGAVERQAPLNEIASLALRAG